MCTLRIYSTQQLIKLTMHDHDIEKHQEMIMVQSINDCGYVYA